jgi:dTDP-4-amino-4,6-dideoxygalactose transaminase
MSLILEVAEKHGLAVIEDAAQAIGARSPQGQQAGSIGLLGCLSFFPSKNLGAFGDGGMIVTHNEYLAEKLQILRVHGGKPKYHYQIIGGNFRLDALQAAVLRVKLPYLPSWTKSRRNNAQRYRLLFEEMKLREYVLLPEDTPGHIYNQFVVRVSDRNRLQGFLRERGVETEVYYPIALHLQQCFQYLGYRKGSFLHAEAAATETLSLPIYPELTAEQQRYVVNQIKAFYQQ